MLVLSMFYTIFVPMSNAFIPDASQELVLNLTEGLHLVLAPPGCGKTQILAERLKKPCGTRHARACVADAFANR